MVLIAGLSLSAGITFSALAQGPTPGPATGPGTTAKTQLWARVASDGALSGSDGATAARRATAGDYRVTFSRNIRRCAMTATMNAPSSATTYEMVGGIEAVAVADKVVRVVTYNENSGPVSNNFHLVVNCKSAATPTPGSEGDGGGAESTTTSTTRWARVDSGGSLTANSGVASASRSVDGDYRVTFDDAVEDCALTATMLGTSSSYHMIGGIEAVAISSKVVRVVTYNQNSGPASKAFHVVATC